MPTTRVWTAGFCFLALIAQSFAQSYRHFSTFVNVGGTPDEVGRRMVKAADGSFFVLATSGPGLVVAKFTPTGGLVWQQYYPANGLAVGSTPAGGAVAVAVLDRGNLPTSREVATLKF